MKKSEFISLCEKYTININVALENKTIYDTLASNRIGEINTEKAIQIITHILKTKF